MVLFMDSGTGEITIEGISCDSELTVTKTERMHKFRTGLIYEAGVAAKIRSALEKRGIKVKGVSSKCINISKDWLVQILVILYYGLLKLEKSNRFAYLTNAANINSEWKENPGIELQQLKEKEYWRKVEQFDRSKLAKASPAKPCQPKRNGIKALIVEDELISSRLMFHYISQLGVCDLVSNGKEAIEAFIKAIDKGENYDLITLDIMMPEMNGHEVLKRIRSIEEERGITSTRIIMTSSVDDAKAIMYAFIEQCDGYLVKPISKKALMKRLSELNLTDY